RERGDLPADAYQKEPEVVRLLGPRELWRRTFTLEAGRLSRAADRGAPGLAPGPELHVGGREGLIPALHVLWGVRALGGISGLGERRADLIEDLAWEVHGDRVPPKIRRILEVMGVTHLLAPRPLADPALEPAGSVTAWEGHPVLVYR